jgi:ABC-type multidrug transport system fused ATPase/permease subunit
MEPTSALDAHTEKHIADTLPRTRHGQTTVVATASPSLLRDMDVVHLLVDGAVAASGTHHELMDDERYQSVVRRGEE